MIKVNSQQCGAGKTTQWIYPNIKKLLLQDQKVLLVVPSIDLQMQYLESFAGYITVINNLNCNHVSKSIYEAFERNCKFVCITHQAFELLELSFADKKRYNLIIDEVINPFRLQKINFGIKGYMPNFKFNRIFKFSDKEYFGHKDVDYTLDTSWHELTKANISDSIPFVSSSKQWIDLLNDNYQSYMRYSDYVDLCKQNKKQMVIIQELNPHLIRDWVSVSIAAAAFECTFMRFWLDYNEIEYDVVQKFEVHGTKATFHTPNVNEFQWSKHKKNKYSEILDKYHTYVEDNTTTAPLVIRNNDELRTITDEIKVNHNVHGINLPNRQAITNVSLETALVPDSNLSDFYKNKIGMSKKQITKAYSSYLFYQIVLRSAIRDDIPINIFALDVDTICGLTEFFGDADVIDNIDVDYVAKKAGRPKLPPEQVQANKREYNRKYMAKKRHSK